MTSSMTRRWLTTFVAVLTLALAGCTAAMVDGVLRDSGVLFPGALVEPALVERYCVSQAEFEAMQREYLGLFASRNQAGDRRSPGYAAIPAVGQSACEVLAMLGLPDDVTRVTAADGHLMHWRYWTGNAAAGEERRLHLIQLEPTPDSFQVAVVVW